MTLPRGLTPISEPAQGTTPLPRGLTPIDSHQDGLPSLPRGLSPNLRSDPGAQPPLTHEQWTEAGEINAEKLLTQRPTPVASTLAPPAEEIAPPQMIDPLRASIADRFAFAYGPDFALDSGLADQADAVYQQHLPALPATPTPATASANPLAAGDRGGLSQEFLDNPLTPEKETALYIEPSSLGQPPPRIGWAKPQNHAEASLPLSRRLPPGPRADALRQMPFEVRVPLINEMLLLSGQPEMSGVEMAQEAALDEGQTIGPLRHAVSSMLDSYGPLIGAKQIPGILHLIDEDLADAAARNIQSRAKVNPKYDDSFWLSDAPAAIGSSLSQVPALLMANRAPIVGKWLVPALFGLSTYGQKRREGMDALPAAVAGLVEGGSERMGFDLLTNKVRKMAVKIGLKAYEAPIFKRVMGTMMVMLTGSGVEGVEEVVSAAGDAAADVIQAYRDGEPLGPAFAEAWEKFSSEAPRSFAAGAIAGGAIEGPATALSESANFERRQAYEQARLRRAGRQIGEQLRAIGQEAQRAAAPTPSSEAPASAPMPAASAVAPGESASAVRPADSDKKTSEGESPPTEGVIPRPASSEPLDNRTSATSQPPIDAPQRTEPPAASSVPAEAQDAIARDQPIPEREAWKTSREYAVTRGYRYSGKLTSRALANQVREWQKRVEAGAPHAREGLERAILKLDRANNHRAAVERAAADGKIDWNSDLGRQHAADYWDIAAVYAPQRTDQPAEPGQPSVAAVASGRGVSTPAAPVAPQPATVPNPELWWDRRLTVFDRRVALSAAGIKHIPANIPWRKLTVKRQQQILARLPEHLRPDRLAARKPLAEMSKTERKAWAAAQPVPTALAEDPTLYFDQSAPAGKDRPDYQTVKVADLIPLKHPDTQPKSVDNAMVLMLAAAEDGIPGRKPITVIALGGKHAGKYVVVDGNATYGAALRSGWQQMPVEVHLPDSEFSRRVIAEQIKDDDSRVPVWKAYLEAAGKADQDPKLAIADAVLHELVTLGKPHNAVEEIDARNVPEMVEAYGTLRRSRGKIEARFRELADRYGRQRSVHGELSGELVAEVGMGQGIQDGLAIGPLKQPHRWNRKIVEAKQKEELRTGNKVDYLPALSEGEDLMRCTVVCDSEEQILHALRDLQSGAVSDLAPQRLKDRWTEDGVYNTKLKAQGQDAGYRDLLTNITTEQPGLVVEVQYNIPEILAAKSRKGHAIYERIEAAEKSGLPREDVDALYQESRAAYATALAANVARTAASKRSRETEYGLSSPPQPYRKPNFSSGIQSPLGESTNEPPLPLTTGTSSSPSSSSQKSGSETGKGVISTGTGSTGTIDDKQENVKKNPQPEYPTDTVRGIMSTETDDERRQRNRPAAGGDRPAPALPDAAGPGHSAAGTPAPPGGGRGPAGDGSPPGQPGSERGGDVGTKTGSGDAADLETPQPSEPREDSQDSQPGDGTVLRGGVRGSDADGPVDIGPDRNHRIAAGDVLAPPGRKGKLRANLKALNILRQVENERRQATPEEKRAMAQFTGWGWAGEAFSPTNVKHADEFRQLTEALGGEDSAEFRSARAATTNSHFTSAQVIRSMWSLVNRLGFKGGPGRVILEPSAGVGHVLGLMPEEHRGSRVVAVELDNTTGRLLGALYPDADVLQMGYEEAPIKPNSVDLAISNVPFGAYKVKARDHGGLSIHNYFFRRTFDMLKPGGLMVFITSHFSLDSLDRRVRRAWAEQGDLVGAIRMPNTAQKKSADTSVITDLIVFRKRLPGQTQYRGEPFIEVVEHGTVANKEGVQVPLRINEYFAKHPEMVLGEHAMSGSMHFKDEYTLNPTGDLEQQMREAVAAFPVEQFQAQLTDAKDTAAAPVVTGGAMAGRLREGELVLDEKEMPWVVEDGQLVEPHWLNFKHSGEKNFEQPLSADQTRERLNVARRYHKLRMVYRRLIDLEVDGADEGAIADARLALNQVYDSIRKVNGKPWSHYQPHNEPYRWLEDDPDYELVLGLETHVEGINPKTGKVTHEYIKSPIFTKRLYVPPRIPDHADNPADAVAISLGNLGKVDMDLIARLLGTSKEEAKRLVIESGRAFKDPMSEQLVSRDQYLSGNVRKKLQEARAAAAEDPAYQVNVKELETAQPPRVKLENVALTLSSRWIPDGVKSAFASELFKTPTDVHYSPAGNSHTVVPEDDTTTEITDVYFVRGVSSKLKGDALLTAALDNTTPKITKPHPDDEDKRIPDSEAVELAKEKIEKIRQEFDRWYRTTQTRIDGRSVRELLEDEYNRINNSMVPPNPKGDYLALPGLSKEVYRLPHRLNVVARILQERSGVMAHGVGSGKTYSQIVAAHEMVRLGLANKVLIVVQKATIGQFAASYRSAYPNARILVANDKSFQKAYRLRFMGKIAGGDYEAVIMTQPQFDRLQVRKNTIQAYFDAKLEALEDEIRQSIKAAKGDERDPTVKQLETAKNNLASKLAKMLQKLEKDAIHFEDLGVDFLMIDEAHAYKRAPIVTRKENVKGIPSQASNRAIMAEMKCDFVRRRRPDHRGVVLATGTPVTNTMAEVYVMLKMAAPHVLDEYQITNFDQFADTFGDTRTRVEYNYGLRWQSVTRFNKFVNARELVRMVRSGFDVQIGNEKLGLKVPKIVGGKPEPVVVRPGPALERVFDRVRFIYQRFNDLSPGERREVSWVPITTMQMGSAASLDPRLVDPQAGDDPGSKVNIAVGRIKKIYEQHPGKTQLVFADRFAPMVLDKLEGFEGGRASDIAESDSVEAAIGVEADTDTEKQELDNDEMLAKERERRELEEYRNARFNLYQDIKAKLVKAGIPEREIAIIHDYNTDKRREQLFEALNAGRVRVLLGSTERMGVGVNVQQRLIALHHLDPPRMMTPAMMEQREGRIIRQGNPHEEVYILRYGVEGSLDTAIYQILENKARMINGVLNAELDSSDFEDAADEVTLSLGEQVALMTGDPRVMRKAELESQLNQLRLMRRAAENEIGTARDEIARVLSDNEYFRTFLNRNETALPLVPDMDRPDAIWRVKTDQGTFTADRAKGEEAEKARMLLNQAVQQALDKEARIDINGVGITSRIPKHAQGESIVSFLHPQTDELLFQHEVRGSTGLLAVFRHLRKHVQDHVDYHRDAMKKAEARLPVLREKAAATWPRQAELDRLEKEYRDLENELLGEDKLTADDQKSPDAAGTPEVKTLTAKEQREVRELEKQIRTIQDFAYDKAMNDPDAIPDAERRVVPLQEKINRIRGLPAPSKPQAAQLPDLGGAGKAPPLIHVGPPSAYTDLPAETRTGQTLLKAIRADTQGQRIGLRSIVAYLLAALDVQLRVGREQLTQRHPATYLAREHVVRSRTGQWQIDLHEAGHALGALLQDRDPKALDGIRSQLIELASRRDGFASAQDEYEGFAEWTRLYLMNPKAVNNALTNRIEALLAKHLPQALSALRDTHRLIQAHAQRSPQAVFRSYMTDVPRKARLLETLMSMRDWLLYSLFSGEAALEQGFRKRAWKVLSRAGVEAARQWERSLEGSPADYRSAYQTRLNVAGETYRALHGPESRQAPRGLRVFTAGDEPITRVMDNQDIKRQWNLIFRFGLDKLRGQRTHGQYLYLTDYTVADIMDAVGRQPGRWEAFETYGWTRTALDRYQKKGHAYPGLTEGLSPALLESEMQRLLTLHPHFDEQYHRLNAYMDKLVLVGLLSGEFTPKQAIDIVEAYDSYWPLPRQSGLRIESDPLGPAYRGGGRGRTDPSVGVERAVGSHEPYRSILDAVERRTAQALDAYYTNRLMHALVQATEKAGDLPVPLEIKAAVRRMLTPLRLDMVKVATLQHDEKRRVIADYLNEKAAKEAGIEPAQMPEKDKVQPEDVQIAEPGNTVNIFRETRPRAVRVIGLTERGQRHYFQVEDPILFDFFAQVDQPGKAMKFMADLAGGVQRERKAALTQNLVFAARSIVRDLPTAMLFGETPERFIPGVYLLLGVYNRLTGRFPEAREVGELMSKSYESVHRIEHRTRVQRFLDQLTDGVVLPGYGHMSALDKLRHFPGQAAALALKPVHWFNTVSMGHWVSQMMETLPREGQAFALLRRGASLERAKAGAQRVTGMFAARAGSPRAREAYRMGLFINAAQQINWQLYKALTDPDVQRRNANWMMLGWMATLAALAAALNYLLLDDDDKEKLRERNEHERMGFMPLKVGGGRFLSLPHDYGPPGAFTSMGWNLMESYLLGEGIKGQTAALEVVKRAASLPSLTDLLTTELRVAIELQANYSSFYGHPIVPGYMQDRPAALQAYRTTPRWAQVVGRELGVSPVRLEYATSQLLTAQMNDLLKVAERLVSDQPLAREVADAPYFGRLFVKEPRGYRAQSVQDVLDAADRHAALKSLIQRLEEERVDPRRLDPLRQGLRQTADLAGAMRSIRSLYARAKDARQRGDETLAREVERQMVAVARTALKRHQPQSQSSPG